MSSTPLQSRSAQPDETSTVPKHHFSEYVENTEFADFPHATDQQISQENEVFSICDQTHLPEFVCETCDRFLCSKCAVFHLKEQRTHDVTTIEEANQSLQSQVQAVSINLQSSLESELQKIQRNQNEKENILLDLISEAFQKLAQDSLVKQEKIIQGLLVQIYNQRRPSFNLPPHIQMIENKLLLLKLTSSFEDNTGKPSQISNREFLKFLAEKINSYHQAGINIVK